MFNVAVAAGLVAIVGGTLALVNLSLVTDTIGAGVSAMFASSHAPARNAGASAGRAADLPARRRVPGDDAPGVVLGRTVRPEPVGW